MTPAQVTEVIESEIGIDRSRTNSHGCTFSECLVTPYLAEFKDYRDAAPTIQLWVVLKELPLTDDGYQIVYHEAAKMFGLAVGGAYIGAYGSFLTAFDAM